jgi:beta-galactosidase
MPYHGYRWGTRGSVSSVPIEKPHYGGWQPVFECEFDLAYSPLLTRRHGEGRVTLCTFDLEDHARADPAATRLTHQIIRYAQSDATPHSTASVYYRGDEAGKTLLDSLGLKYTHDKGTALASSGANRLLIVGEGAGLKAAAVRAFARTGGRVLYLAHRTAEKHAESGVEFRVQIGFHGSLSVPSWEECDGLSASDLRLRADSDWIVCAPSSGTMKIGADGLLAREAVGTGSILYCQIDPDRLEADKRTYFRQTRWRQTRALSQIIANMGGTFTSTGSIFSPSPSKTPESTGVTRNYHPDYRTDFDLGDDPYRFYNW